MRTSIAIIVLCTSVACNNSRQAAENEPVQQKNIALASWLLGTWSSRSGDRTSYEIWTKLNDSTYVGKSYSLHKGDTVSYESIQLKQEGESIYYIPTVRDQNNNMPTRFKLMSGGSDTLIYENPEHDFPQRITYRRVLPDSLVAEISGLIDGQHRAHKFPMQKE